MRRPPARTCSSSTTPRVRSRSSSPPMAGYGVTMASFFRPTVTEQYPREPARVMPRFHGRHQLNRYDDGLEKCVGCELCAWACPADAIFVEAASNTPEEQYSAGERYGRVYQINYLRASSAVCASRRAPRAP